MTKPIFDLMLKELSFDYLAKQDMSLSQGEHYSTSIQIAETISRHGAYPLFHKSYSLRDILQFLTDIISEPEETKTDIKHDALEMINVLIKLYMENDDGR